MAGRDTGRGTSAQRNRQLGDLRYSSKTSIEKRTAASARLKAVKSKGKVASEGTSPDKSDASAKSAPVERVRRFWFH